MKKILLSLTLLFAISTFAIAQSTPQETKKVAKTADAAATKKARAKAASKKAAPVVAAAQAATPAAPAVKGPAATFEKTELDYGKIEQGSEPLRIFSFKNTGSEPLIISGAQGSCGCTVPTYPKEPIMPGQSSKIEVRYDTQRVGPFSKSVTLTTNEANNTRVLTIKGDVSAKTGDTPAATTNH